MTEQHKHHDLIIAWAKGASIEWFDPERGRWVFVSRPVWDDDLQFRVKPTPEWMPEPGQWVVARSSEGRQDRVTMFQEYRHSQVCPWKTTSGFYNHVKPFPLQVERDRYRAALETIAREGTSCCFIGIAKDALGKS